MNLPILALLALHSVAPPKVPLVAISRLNAIKVDSGEVDVLGESLASALVSTGKVRVMERSQMDRILTEQGFQQSGACEGGECAIQVGRLLGVDRIVVGSVGRIGHTCALNLRTVNISTGEVVGISSRTVQGDLEAVIQILPAAAQELVGATAQATSPTPTSQNPAPAAPKGSAKGYFGFRFVRAGAPAMQAIRSLQGVPDTGVLISQIVSGSPAAQAGLHVDDLILEVDGGWVLGVDNLQSLLANHQPGDQVAFRIKRSRQSLVLNVLVGHRP